MKTKPGKNTKCCYNCKFWRIKDYIHCQHSGPWGGDIIGDSNCTFISKHSKGDKND
jgi:hypothetical protein